MVTGALRQAVGGLLVSLLPAFGFAGPDMAARAKDTAFDGVLEATVEPLAETPFEEEMVLLTIRGFYPENIALQSLQRPEFNDVGWMELGKDTWIDTTYEGRKVKSMTRIMAVFPKRGGRITIPPFVHRLTMVTRTGTREAHEVRSDPVSFEVRAKPAVEGWWLPARALRVTDSWDRAPDQLPPGGLARRIVTLEAVGLPPGQLPPPPAMRSPGVMTFSDPEQRSHELTTHGPISRVIWRWTFRLPTSTPAILEPVSIAWFDTKKRRDRVLTIAQQRIAFAGSQPLPPERASLLRVWSDRLWPVAVAIGFALGLGLLIPGLQWKTRRDLSWMKRLLPNPNVRALRRAARAGDVAAMRFAAQRLVFAENPPVRPAIDPDVEGCLADLDRAAFAPPAARAELDVPAAVNRLLRLRRFFAA